MNKQLKKRWLKALRSGEYEQGTTYLNYQGRYCCLGVLCELLVKDGILEAQQMSMGNVRYRDPKNPGDTQSSRLPRRGVAEAELVDYYGRVPIKGNETRSLAGLNDGGASFEEIANIIERRL